jgi:hypothetical protein
MGEIKRRNRGHNHPHDDKHAEVGMDFFERIIREEVDKVIHETPTEPRPGTGHFTR